MRIVLMLAMCFVLAACGCGKKKTVQNSAFSGKDYSIVFPESWEINDTGVMGLDIIGLSPLEDSKDEFRENVNVVLENLPKSISEKEYLEACRENMDKAFGLAPEAQFEKTTVGNADAYHLRYSLQMGKNEMDNDVYIVIKNGAAYILTCSNAKGKRDAFKATMDSVVGTFAVK